MAIGDPIEHSLSPQMHNRGFKELGIDNNYVFVACKVKVSEIPDFIKGVRAMGIRGISCTLPHKTEVIKYLDSVDDTARKIGAVNTIVNDNGILKGYNTDWIGVTSPLEKKTLLTDKRVALLGAGGAARAAAFAFTNKGAKLTIYNRSLEKAEELAKEFKAEAMSLWDIVHVKDADIIFNATSVGMDSEDSLIPKQFISKNQIVFDAIYTPFETQLLRDAKQKGATIIHGLEMLLCQGIEQFKLYTGYEAPEEAMRAVLLENLK